MKKYIFLTNIPTPYRTSFYNELYKCGLNFEVFYMRNIEDDRNWDIDLSSMKFPFFIDKGFYRMVGRFHVHLNFRLIRMILKQKDSEIIIGGGWNDPDVLILVILKRLGILRKNFHFWSEANYLTIGASNDNFLKKYVRMFVYNSTRGSQISSGKMTELTLKKWGIRIKGFVSLPNTIEEEVFTITEDEIEKRHQNSTPIFLMPVRLLENVKGIVNFFTSIGEKNIRRAEFIVAGEGPDKAMIENYIKVNQYQENIKLVGHCSTSQMVSLYKKANIFVLPSFSDPSPLSLIEALKMRLPVLVSNRCGNHYEAVINGHNGYLFDPGSPKSICDSFEEIINRIQDWRNFGEVSAEVYKNEFEKEKTIKRFIKELTSFASL